MSCDRTVLCNILVIILVVMVGINESAIRHQNHRFEILQNSSWTTAYRIKNNFQRLRDYLKSTQNPKFNIYNSSSSTQKYNISSPNIVSYKDFYEQYQDKKSGLEELKTKLNPNYSTRARSASSTPPDDLQKVRQVNKHLLMMRRRGKCIKPMAKVINIQDVYPDVTKQYVPKCTILYRCDNQAGCCDDASYQCMPRSAKYVRLYFYTSTLKVDPVTQKTSSDRKIESFLFQNHTECGCQAVYDIPRMATNPYLTTSTSPTPLSASYVPLKVVNPVRTHVTQEPLLSAEVQTTTTTAPITEVEEPKVTFESTTPLPRKIRCRDCPLPFNKRPYADGGCSCDCFDKQRECIRIKRGKEFLEETERRCVEAKYCHEPECEFGNYMTTHGRCPKRSERRRRNRKHHFKFRSDRWTAHERD